MKESLLKQVIPLGFIIGFRFFGLFVVMPLLALYTLSLEGVTPILVGVVVGGYALTQVLFQIPFGILSDRIGRKSIIFIGLLIFACGSFICALSDNIYMLIIGRLLQGAGAIGGVVSAMIADLVKEESRTKAMALMGGIISLSFTAALIIGPLLGAALGVKSLFGITCALGILGIAILVFFVPNAPKITYSFNGDDFKYNDILKNKNLLIMNLTNFLQKGFMTLAFLIIPIALVKAFDMSKNELYQIYIPAAVLGFLAMIPAAIVAEKRGRFKSVLVFGILLFVLAYFLMGSSNQWIFIAGILIFFIGFSMHEPIMQSLASRYCKAHQKGSALGVFTSFGYLGSFLGALVGAHLYEFFGMFSISIFVAIVSLLWILSLVFLANPTFHKMLYLPLKESEGLESLSSLQGVLEWYINECECIAVIKYDKHLISEEEIMRFVKLEMADKFLLG
ncbi:MFS transporter [Helicobacter mesocricetorum]|uniref:MFS transporter n=1 Tax=Helicobacter mesocricetorum TaxID=87012 RepID=UPI000CF159F8|nr:MFS transporter [Helicobacter mesocricetorum]